jgi:DNA-binding response OmpR family regulator
VVDDEAMMRTFNAEVLTSYGYHVDDAEDGALAWDRLQINSYDLLITDNVMPKVSGIQLIEKVHAARMALPVILAAGALPKNDFMQCPWLQPAAILVKPYTIDEFLGTVKNVLCPVVPRAISQSHERP